jgi:hypothetical protein
MSCRGEAAKAGGCFLRRATRFGGQGIFPPRGDLSIEASAKLEALRGPQPPGKADGVSLPDDVKAAPVAWGGDYYLGVIL